MLSLEKKLLLLLLSLVIPTLAGCETLTSENKIPANAGAIASAIGHIRPSPKDTCETRQQAAEQSSRIDTMITGKVTVYKADCKDQKPKQAATS